MKSSSAASAKRQARSQASGRSVTGGTRVASTSLREVPVGPTNGRAHMGFLAAEFLANPGLDKVIVERRKNSTIFSQGDTADSVFYVQKGKVKLGVVSAQGKEATFAVLGAERPAIATVAAMVRERIVAFMVVVLAVRVCFGG